MTEEEREQIEQEIDEALASQGQSAWYGWRPNQIWTRNPNDPSQYVSTDVMTDGTFDEIRRAAEEEAERQVDRIVSLADEAVSAINRQTPAFERIKSVYLQALYSLRGLFRQYGIPAAVAILDAAIEQINEVTLDE